MFSLVTVTVDSPATPQDAQTTTATPTIALADLRGLRSAPQLGEPQRLQLRQELEQAIAPYSWFTLGVMASDVETAISVLRRVETALGWPRLQPAPNIASAVFAPKAASQDAQMPSQGRVDGADLDNQSVGADAAFPDAFTAPSADSPSQALPVFLKGNQRTGLFQVRPEAGLGEGLLITGQEPLTTIGSETWGPLPLDLFA